VLRQTNVDYLSAAPSNRIVWASCSDHHVMLLPRHMNGHAICLEADMPQHGAMAHAGKQHNEDLINCKQLLWGMGYDRALWLAWPPCA